jgi:hypothetical protein
VLIGIVFLVLFRCAKRDRTTFALIGGGLFLIALADSIFTYLDVHEAYVSGSFIDPMWTGGMLLIFLGALHRPRFAGEARDERWIDPTWGSVPYIPLVLSVICATVIQITQGALPPFAFWTAVVVILFVTTRQVVALAAITR